MIVGVLGGSFNPVHKGHIALAREIVAKGLVDKVLMVLSPLNPLKQHLGSLLDDAIRMDMLRLACESYSELEACDIELTMPRPSYTIDTLRKLSTDNPADCFRLVIGADNWACFQKWRSPDEIIRDYSPIVYPREEYQMPEEGSGATPFWAEILPVSSTEIRNRIANGESVDRLRTVVAEPVLEYIQTHSLYQISHD